MPSHKKCSRGKKYKKSYRRSNGTKVKGHCYSPKKASKKTSRKVSHKKSRKVSRKRSMRKVCPPGQAWRKSHRRSSGKRVKGQCVKSRYAAHAQQQDLSRYFVNLTPSAPPMPSAPSAFVASSLFAPVNSNMKEEEKYADMPALERVF